MARQPLGRGLSALLGEKKPPANQSAAESAPVSEVDTDLLEPNPDQPRSRFTESTLYELAKSIEANGLVQPILVRKNGKRYQIIAGERRWRAAQIAGVRKVPVVIRDIPNDKLLEIALIENIQREELNPVEEAKAYRKLIDKIGLTQEELSERVGRERSLIATSLRLLKLPDEVLELLETGKLSAGHGRALLLTDDRGKQIEAAMEIVEKGLSVRDAERLLRSAGRQKKQTRAAKPTQNKDPNLRLAETKLMRSLGTSVRINPMSGSKGTIEIEYYSDDHLQSLYDRLLNSKEA
ncbi:MAG TPA: ParB/RepB/Spo0J family partition protein [Pyrinomonadaceae bacterium]|nr:ParB/RepB/Spo0J family partition protein [Pyrinomonadaceae bacterium]